MVPPHPARPRVVAARKRLAIPVLLLAILLITLPSPKAKGQSDPCEQPKPVCNARVAVFAVSGFDPYASAVRIGATRLVTARHVVADDQTVRVFLADGQSIEARVLPTDYPGDLVLLESMALPPGPSLMPNQVMPEASLFTVGADIVSKHIRAYDPGHLRLAPPPDRPLARLHHDAFSQPGNSGGALVDETGRLVGIVASGGEGRFEAIPAEVIAALADRSGPNYMVASFEIGSAVRICTTLLEEQRGIGESLNDETAEAITSACRRSGNRQLMDLAGQALGREGLYAAAIALFEQGLAEDPNAINTRIGLVITYYLARDFEAALPHLRWLMEHADDDLQVVRLSIQSGIWAGDEALARRALARLRELDPQSVPAAERFLNNPPPRPAKAY